MVRRTRFSGVLARSLPLVALGLGLVGLPADGRAAIETEIGADGVISLSNQKSRTPKAKKSAAARALSPVMPASGGASRYGRFEGYVAEAAQLYQLPTALIRAVMKVESNFDPRAVSRANAQGLMQLMPQTAERMMVTDIFDPRQNILGGARYLRILANTFHGDLSLTVAGYNAGEGAVARYGGIPPYAETQQYVQLVTHYYREFLVSH